MTFYDGNDEDVTTERELDYRIVWKATQDELVAAEDELGQLKTRLAELTRQLVEASSRLEAASSLLREIAMLVGHPAFAPSAELLEKLRPYFPGGAFVAAEAPRSVVLEMTEELREALDDDPPTTSW